mmetsp:Transcript_17480/g.28399  ORF Transcript_17480/g.28399 Transcript_17480/m.28399 type:complete len:190 (+) Transcript_17480:60-629(+)
MKLLFSQSAAARLVFFFVILNTLVSGLRYSRSNGPSLSMKALNQQNQASGPILVVGGTGQLGRFVVDELSSRGLGPTRCLVRNPTSESAMALAQIPGVEIVKGDLTEPEDIKAAVTGCKACICCSGPKRLSRVSDLWRDPAGDRGHPYEVNFRGVANLAAALKAAGATKIVRVTGLSGDPAGRPEQGRQ